MLVVCMVVWGQLCSDEFETCEAASINLAVKKGSKPQSAVTYALDCGRFGDQLINYIKALWISHQYGLKFLYKPFSFSDQLQCCHVHHHYDDYKHKYKRIVHSSKDWQMTEQLIDEFEKCAENSNHSKGLLYIISFHTPIIEEWENEDFRTILASLVKPIIPIMLLELPKDKITIAVHVRTGIGHDKPGAIEKYPTKFPSDGYYIKSLKHTADIFEGQPLYVYIFTDHPEPATLRDRYKGELKDLGISNELIVDCRLTENRYNLNVLEDFFHMMQFDCIIRPDSSYSRAAAAISGPIVEICPPREFWMHPPGKLEINDIDAVLNSLQVQFRPAKGKNMNDNYVVRFQE